MKVDAGTGALMLSTATAVPSIMGAFCEKPSRVALGPSDPAALGELRRGEIVGAGAALLVAAVLGSIITDPAARRLVYCTAILMIGVYVFEHERALRVSPCRPDEA